MVRIPPFIWHGFNHQPAMFSPTAEINVPYNDWVSVIWNGFYVVLVNTSDVVVFTWSAWQFSSYFKEYIKEFSTILYFFLFAAQNRTARKLLECVGASTKELEWDSILTPCANWFCNEFTGDLSTNRLAEGIFCDLTWFSASLCLLYYVENLIKT